MVGIERQGSGLHQVTGDIGTYRLVNSTWAKQVLAELHGLEPVKKKGEQALIVPLRQSPDLNLDYGVGELRALLLLLL